MRQLISAIPLQYVTSLMDAFQLYQVESRINHWNISASGWIRLLSVLGHWYLFLFLFFLSQVFDFKHSFVAFMKSEVKEMHRGPRGYTTFFLSFRRFWRCLNLSQGTCSGKHNHKLLQMEHHDVKDTLGIT